MAHLSMSEKAVVATLRFGMLEPNTRAAIRYRFTKFGVKCKSIKVSNKM